jgi:hypothetical protein
MEPLPHWLAFDEAHGKRDAHCKKLHITKPIPKAKKMASKRV